MTPNMKGKITLGGKQYLAEIINGIQYVEGKTIDEFIKTLSPDDFIDAAIIGHVSITNPEISPLKVAKELHSKRNN